MIKDEITSGIDSACQTTLALLDKPDLNEDQKQAIIDIATVNWQKGYRKMAETVSAYTITEEKIAPDPKIEKITSQGSMNIAFNTDVF